MLHIIVITMDTFNPLNMHAHNAVQFVARPADQAGGALLSNVVTDGANNNKNSKQPKTFLRVEPGDKRGELDLVFVVCKVTVKEQ